MLNKLKNRSSTHIVEVVFISISLFCVVDLAMAETPNAWSCGAWVTDKNDSCKEVKTCTRTVCSSLGKCAKETQTSTATKANCTPLNQKPGAGRFTKGIATSGTMARPPASSPVRLKPTTSMPVLQPNAIVNNPRVSNKPVITKGAKPVINRGATTKQPNKSKPTTKVKMPANKNTTSLPYSRNRPTVKQPKLSGVPVVRTTKPQDKNLVAVPVVNEKSELSPFNQPIISNKPTTKAFVPVNSTLPQNHNVYQKPNASRTSGFVPVRNVNSQSKSNKPSITGMPVDKTPGGFVPSSKTTGAGLAGASITTQMMGKHSAFQKLQREKEQDFMKEQEAIRKYNVAPNGRTGTRIGGTDCNDNRHDAKPNGIEVCDGIDNDCDGHIDEGTTLPYYLDADGDAHGDPASRLDVCPAEVSRAADEGTWLVPIGNDCDDNDAERWNNCN